MSYDTIMLETKKSASLYTLVLYFLPPAYVRTTGGYVFTGVCLLGGGEEGSQVSDFWGGGPRSQILGGEGVPGLRFWGGEGVPGLRFWGGPRSQIFGGGPRSQ